MNLGIGPRDEWVGGEFAFRLGGFDSRFVGIVCVVDVSECILFC